MDPFFQNRVLKTSSIAFPPLFLFFPLPPSTTHPPPPQGRGLYLNVGDATAHRGKWMGEGGVFGLTSHEMDAAVGGFFVQWPPGVCGGGGYKFWGVPATCIPSPQVNFVRSVWLFILTSRQPIFPEEGRSEVALPTPTLLILNIGVIF